jgi:quercetin dioxygenase-like cupin family protein
VASTSVVHPDEVEPRAGAAADVRVTFGPHNGCERLEQTVVRIARGSTYVEPASEERQVVLYVAAGMGTLRVNGRDHPVAADTGAFVVPGEAAAIRNDGKGELVIVAVHAPKDRELATAERKVIVRYADQPELEASSERSFRYLVNEDAGCFDVTQFVGIVQPSKAPFHSHPYDEVGYIIDGTGTAHVDGTEIPLRAGSCFHLGPQQVHCIENSGPGEMRILGVFHPSGSPANRSYEDNK